MTSRNYFLRYFKIKTMITMLVLFIFVMLFMEIFKYQQLQNDLYQLLAADDDNNEFATINIPGSFIKKYLYSNETYCNFNYGLPYKFNYNFKTDVDLTPELGLNSSYRVLYNVINSTLENSQLPQLTLCTHATPEYLYHFSEIVRFWDGAISLAIFVPNYDLQIAVNHLNHLCNCLPEMYKVSIHLVFSANDIPRLYPEYNEEWNKCSIPATVKDTITYRSDNHLEYPVNVARNVARLSARTKFVFVTDVELIPSMDLAQKFMNMIERIQIKNNKRAERGDSSVQFNSNTFRYVFVVPVFEVESNEKVPRTKLKLQEMYANDKAVFFHRFTCMHCQKFPGLQKWIMQTADPNIMKPLVVTKREFPYHRWEALFIGTNQDPWYSEQLSWEGLQDKMTQMLEMCLMKYRFVILDNAFLVHSPGIKRQKNSDDVWRYPYQQRNAKFYKQILYRLAKKYDKNPKCRLQ